MTDETYNGWTNYPTWAVNLWLSNDQGLYREVERMAEGRREGFVGTAGMTPRLDLADALKSFVCDDLAPDLGASFAADLLGYALDQVDWLEIADDWLDV